MNPPHFTCECKSYEFRSQCRHVLAVEAYLTAGGILELPARVRSRTAAGRVYEIREVANDNRDSATNRNKAPENGWARRPNGLEAIPPRPSSGTAAIEVTFL